MVRRVAVYAFAVITLAALAFAQPQDRTFTFTYAFSVRNPEQGKPLRVWFPKAHSDKYQSVRLISETGDLPVAQTHDSRGNEVFYAETPSATRSEYRFSAVYQVTRRERLGFQEIEDGRAKRLMTAQLQPYLRPDTLVPVTGEPARIAASVVQGKSTELAKARAIYDYIFSIMRYDKTGTGWGHGDALWACNSKRGNCTDFHSLFAAMARSQGIPTRFSIGFPLPEDKHEGEVPGYHCWADFYVPEKGWIPVDISEAWKHPEKKDYFFGAHDDNRVQFTTGRDLTLNPPQDGAPLNYFIYPYAETNGKPLENIRNDFSFRDIENLKEAVARP